MKKIFVLLIIGFLIKANTIKSTITVSFFDDTIATCSTQETYQQSLRTEKDDLRMLYWYDTYRPHYYKLKDFNFDYFILILKNHIKKLENKLLHKDGWKRSTGMYKSLITTVIPTIMLYTIYQQYTLSRLNTDDTHDFMPVFIHLGFMTTLISYIAGTQWYRLSRYNERLLERLERDKRILTFLETEKISLDAHNAFISSICSH